MNRIQFCDQQTALLNGSLYFLLNLWTAFFSAAAVHSVVQLVVISG